MAPILKLDDHDEEREREFSLDHLLSLTTRQRFAMVVTQSNAIKRMLIQNGHWEPSGITKRECR